MFKDRFDAAHQLAQALQEYKGKADHVIIAIPRGALEIGYVLAQELKMPLDVLFSKKIGAPGQPELAIGAVSLEDELIDTSTMLSSVSKEYIEAEKKKVREILKQREQRYRKGKKPISFKNKVVIVVDDGIATGTTLRMTVKLLKKQQPKKIIVAVPVAPLSVIRKIKKEVDEVVCLFESEHFFGVGQFYEHFSQVEDERAIELLHKAGTL